MARTRETLRELGQSAINDDVLVEAGKKVLRDGVREYLASKGLAEAVGFEITLKNGETFTILSDENPRMSTPLDQVEKIEPRQSAKAGGLVLDGNLLSVTLLF